MACLLLLVDFANSTSADLGLKTLQVRSRGVWSVQHCLSLLLITMCVFAVHIVLCIKYKNSYLIEGDESNNTENDQPACFNMHYVLFMVVLLFILETMYGRGLRR